MTLATGVQSPAFASDCYVLSVGIGDYPRADKLNASVKDAQNIAAAFAAQQGRYYRTVYSKTLLDSEATLAKIAQHVQNFARQGSAGDYFVIALNGHGGLVKDSRAWYFFPYDHVPNDAKSNLTDKQLLDDAEVLVRQGKNVVIIVDACFAGALNKSAESYFQGHKNLKKGGLILMLSCGPEQTSTGLSHYSPFARALAEALSGAADLDRDGKITLEEIRKFVTARTNELLKQKQPAMKQDCEFAWSPSVHPNEPLAFAQRKK